MTQQFPEGLTVANGRYRLTKLLRGVEPDGLWLATDGELGIDVWVTLRNARPKQVLVDKLTFSAYGVAPPLYVGPPDAYRLGDDHVPSAFVAVIDKIPEGRSIAEVGRLDVREALQLGIDLCDVITDWAAARGGYVLHGLRPETVFVSETTGTRRFTGATPRPYYMLGDEPPYGAYPYPSFTTPTDDPEPAPHDALFVVALLIWYAVTGIHPYVIPDTNMRSNQWEDKRLPFDGPQPLGQLLERALVADPALRISVADFKSGLAALLASRDHQSGTRERPE